jgi:hypothetical protein
LVGKIWVGGGLKGKDVSIAEGVGRGETSKLGRKKGFSVRGVLAGTVFVCAAHVRPFGGGGGRHDD